MSISSRTDKNHLAAKRSATAATMASRQHTEALRAKEVVMVADLRAKGISCKQCLHRRRVKFTLYCQRKGGKQITPFNICHLYEAPPPHVTRP